ncbi:MAG: DnaJ C-terminal domain-containing protein [Pseudomonadota bacterium]
MRDPYKVLGVPKGADSAAVKSAYRKLAKTYHPDQNPDDPKAKERFAEVSSAYDILGDETKRRAFDRGEIGADGNPTMAGFNPFGGGGRAQGGPNPGFEDIFASFSRSRGPGYQGFSSSSGFPGGNGGSADAEEMLRSMFGQGGMGAGMGGGPMGGGPGMGAGNARQRAAQPPKGDDVKVVAKVTLEEVLAEEKVQVSLPGQAAVKVSLPKGVENGQTIRLKGKGKPSSAGGKAGDALVSIVFASHPTMKADGAQLTMDLPVTLDEAVLGGKVSIATLDGTVSLTLHEGTQSGRVMRLKGRGLPGKDGARGDLLVKVLIKLPEDGDEALAALMRRWRTDGRYTVR